jgi:hypothetical protein
LRDHIVGGGQQRFRDGKGERLGGLEIDDQLELGRLRNGKVGWLLASENAPGVYASLVTIRSRRRKAARCKSGHTLAPTIPHFTASIGRALRICRIHLH